MPLMIGSSVMRVDDSIMVLGGGATCFSMGTYWQGGASTISIHNKPIHWKHSKPTAEGLTRPHFMGSQRFVNSTSRSQHQGSKEVDATMTTVARTTLETPQQLRDILEAAVPVIISKTDIGDCVWKWTSSYMIDRVGHDTQVRDANSYIILSYKMTEIFRLSYMNANRILKRWISIRRTSATRQNLLRM